MQSALITEFQEPGTLTDDDLELVLAEWQPGSEVLGYAPSYRFEMRLTGTATRVGRIELRVGNNDNILLYDGHIGYGVNLPFRGRRYAARACRLVLPFAWSHGLDPVWITCNPENTASRRTCELAGAEYVETVPLPEYSDLYRNGDRHKCRYRIMRHGDILGA